MRVSGLGGAKPPARKKSVGSAGAFAADKSSAEAPHQSEASAPSSMLDALINLQSRGGGKAKTFAAAQRTLDVLGELQTAILSDGLSAAELDALEKASNWRPHAEADENLQEISREIQLRARVELAKRGR